MYTRDDIHTQHACPSQDRNEVLDAIMSPEFVVKNYYENPIYMNLDTFPSVFKWIPRVIGEPVLIWLTKVRLLVTE